MPVPMPERTIRPLHDQTCWAPTKIAPGTSERGWLAASNAFVHRSILRGNPTTKYVLFLRLREPKERDSVLNRTDFVGTFEQNPRLLKISVGNKIRTRSIE